jgi:hypothetical protein
MALDIVAVYSNFTDVFPDKTYHPHHYRSISGKRK